MTEHEWLECTDSPKMADCRENRRGVVGVETREAYKRSS